MANTYYQQRQALGSQVHIALVSDAKPTIVNDLMRSFWLDIFLFEKRCSRFIHNSELSLFNRSAGNRQPVTAEFRDVLLAARSMGRLTGGLYNPFVLPALQQAGYKQSLVPEYSDDVHDDHSTKRLVPVEALEIGDDWASIPYGTAIDLGGCGKGFIGDVMAGRAEQTSQLLGYWFSVGGDVVTGGMDEHGQPWTVYISPHIKDLSESQRIGSATAPKDGGRFAVATSTVRFRKGQAEDGKMWHHIIDPRSGKPAETNVLLASIAAKTLLEADVLASCVIIEGYPDAKAWLADKAVDGLLVQTAGIAKGQPPIITDGGVIKAVSGTLDPKRL